MTAVATNPIPDAPCTALLFGGTFDPPHRGHLTLPIEARDEIGADLVVYIPAGRSPHKRSNPIASGAQRVEMLRAGLAHHERTAIATLEVDGEDTADEQHAPSYTVDTLERLHAERPEATLRLLIGADQARSFDRWREPERVAELAPPVVILRPGVESDDLEQLLPNATFVRTRELVDASSTEARRLLHAGVALDHPRFGHLLIDPVLDYIEREGLYRE